MISGRALFTPYSLLFSLCFTWPAVVLAPVLSILRSLDVGGCLLSSGVRVPHFIRFLIRCVII
jgi:NO-binding membrane sensor protein with MHYT domain